MDHRETKQASHPLVLIGLVLAGAVIGAALTLALVDDEAGQVADMAAQGASEGTLATRAARLDRAVDGLRAVADVPTPDPGSYEYPTADMAPPDSGHPEVLVGSPGQPEVFTMWMFVFNHPEGCTDGLCDFDDIGADTAALGGVHQVDGRIAADERLVMEGALRVGVEAARGAPLVNPLGAEVHLAIAPHGMAHTGDALHRQLNGPIGDPSLWWAASFLPPS